MMPSKHLSFCAGPRDNLTLTQVEMVETPRVGPGQELYWYYVSPTELQFAHGPYSSSFMRAWFEMNCFQNNLQVKIFAGEVAECSNPAGWHTIESIWMNPSIEAFRTTS